MSIQKWANNVKNVSDIFWDLKIANTVDNQPMTKGNTSNSSNLCRVQDHHS